MESSLKIRFNIIVTFFVAEKVERFQLCPKTAESLFLSSCVTFPIHLIDTGFVGLVKMWNFTFDELTVAKSEFVKHSL